MTDRDTIPPLARAERQIDEILTAFENARYESDQGTEIWFARDLMKIFEYKQWKNFRNVIASAWQACKNSEIHPSGHFVRADGSVAWTPEEIFADLGKKSGRGRPSENVIVSRYAAYLIAENADPSKLPVALAQRYFAEQTRRQELADRSLDALTEDQKRLLTREEVTEQQKGLASAAQNAGVATQRDFAVFQTEGYKGMYGGLNVDGIKKVKGIPRRDAILDRMGSAELAANLFRATQTEERLRLNDVRTKAEANSTHHTIGKNVRTFMIENGGRPPEDIPAADHIRNARKRIDCLADERETPLK